MPAFASTIDYKAKGGDKILALVTEAKIRAQRPMKPVKLAVPDALKPPSKKRSRTK